MVNTLTLNLTLHSNNRSQQIQIRVLQGKWLNSSTHFPTWRGKLQLGDGDDDYSSSSSFSPPPYPPFLLLLLLFFSSLFSSYFCSFPPCHPTSFSPCFLLLLFFSSCSCSFPPCCRSPCFSRFLLLLLFFSSCSCSFPPCCLPPPPCSFPPPPPLRYFPPYPPCSPLLLLLTWHYSPVLTFASSLSFLPISFYVDRLSACSPAPNLDGQSTIFISPA